MTTISGLACAVIVSLLAACAGSSAPTQTQACGPPTPLREGWSASFVAGCIDRDGRYAGGSQVIHLVAHRGELYAGSGYWKDKRNVWYGGRDPQTGWAQILRLSGPDRAWTVDLEFGPRHLRPELLYSAVFTRDAAGRSLPSPESVLIAATYDGNGSGGVSVFVRDDASGRWIKTKAIAGDTGQRGEDNSVRAAAVYRDRATGRESLFLSVGVLGLLTGTYDPTLPGRIAWSSAPEPGSASSTRILSIVEANDSLFFSDGSRIMRRIDGPAPAYVAVADMSDEIRADTPRALFQSIGGVRGLSAIPGPTPDGRSLIFMWHGGRLSAGCVIRLDPRPDGSYAREQETCLADRIGRHVGGATVPFVLGAYSTFMPLRDPRTNTLSHIVGLEAFIGNANAVGGAMPSTASNMRTDKGGFYAGGLYALRDAQGGWRVGEVNGKFQPGQPEFVSVYTYALSPFAEPGRRVIYLGGYDPNHFASSNTAWVASADLMTLLGPAAVQP